MNSGEYNEIVVKLKLIELRDKKEPISIDGHTLNIGSVGFDGVEYPELPLNTNLQRLSREQRISLATSLNITKSSTVNKGDVQINNKYYSIKSLEAAPPALVNHTNRIGWVNVCNECNVDIDTLDDIIEKYWELRLKGEIKEDIHNSNKSSPFFEHKDYLKPLLNYYFFTGSGSGKSPKPAEYLLDIHDPLDVSTWHIYGEEYLDSVWGRLVFSLRSKKGMPPYYPLMVDREKLECISKWTKLHQGSHRGSLHVRVK
jgi:hypothetical protein